MENKKNILTLAVVGGILLLAIILIFIITNNISRGITSVCPTHGSQTFAFVRSDSTSHWYKCPECDHEISGAHRGGTHPKGECTDCGNTYQTHGMSSTIKEYVSIDETTHKAIHGCIFPECSSTYAGDTSAHTFSGNTCTACGATKTTGGSTDEENGCDILGHRWESDGVLTHSCTRLRRVWHNRRTTFKHID